MATELSPTRVKRALGLEIGLTAAELNKLNGMTANTAELNLLDGSIAGTSVASKALVLGASKETDTLTLTTLKPVANGMFGAGMVTGPSNISANTTSNLTFGAVDPVQFYNYANGAAAYVHNIDLDTANGAFEGAIFKFALTKTASNNGTYIFRNGIGGSNIVSVQGTNNIESYACEFIFDGTAWRKFQVIKNSN